MKLLEVPALPTCLGDHSQLEWEKWYGFWALPLDQKADVVDEYPDLLIERQPSPEAAQAGMKVFCFFDARVFEKVPASGVLKHWDKVSRIDTYPTQVMSEDDVFYIEHVDSDLLNHFLFRNLSPLNYAVLGYKYRHVRPEEFYFGMDYEVALLEAATLEDLLSFYERPNTQR